MQVTWLLFFLPSAVHLPGLLVFAVHALRLSTCSIRHHVRVAFTLLVNASMGRVHVNVHVFAYECVQIRIGESVWFHFGILS